MDIVDRMKHTCGLVVAVVLGAHPAAANSYLEMITTPPEGYMAEVSQHSVAERAPLWYDSRIQTSSPVVTSELPKYLAWQQAKAYENNFSYVRDDMQNAVYFLSGAALARLAYDIWGPSHRHHLLGH